MTEVTLPLLGAQNSCEPVLCDEMFPGKMAHTLLLTPNREPTENKSMNTTKVQISEPMSIIGVTHKWVRDYIQEEKGLKGR